MSQDTILKQIFNDLIQQQERLVQQRERLKDEIDEIEVAINVIKRQYKFERPTHKLNDSNSISNSSKSYQSKLFDIDSSIDKGLKIDNQIIQGFEAVGKLVKLKEFAKWFKKSTGSSKAEGGIMSLIRKMKARGAVVSVKFNDNDANTFWGLPHWITETGGKSEIVQHHYPDSNEITENSPYEVNRK